MIANRIVGGLGNQMFQYAFGHYLARKYNTEHVLDISSYDDDMQREFVLDRYGISARLASPLERRRFIRRYGGLGWMGYALGRTPMKRLKERSHGFRPEYLETGDDIFLDGYWQSEKHFPGVFDELRNEFQPIVPMSDETLAVAREMGRRESASLHVRRTDYLQVWYTTVCSGAYYQRAVDYLLRHYPGICLFVFSDDVDWCRQHLHFPCPMRFVGHNDGSTGHEDMWLMSQCRHHVIANSTFSWWGARLGIDPTGETLAPDPWFSHPDMDGSAVIPPSWRKISSSPEEAAAA